MQAGGGGSESGRSAGALYKGFRSRRSAAMMGDINVTPLVDVVLVLLLVFMVTAPIMSRGIDVALPVADQPQIQQEDRITVSVKADGRVYVGERPVNIVLLEEQVRGLMMGRSAKVIYLAADEALRYGRVIEVVDKLKKAGVEQIGFVYKLPPETPAGT